VLAFQREAGFLVFEFEVQAQRRPAFGGVAITARNFNAAVRMVRRGDLCAGRIKLQQNEWKDPFQF
jgi:hypothetical protein